MTAKKRRGQTAKTVQNLVVQLCSGIISDIEFEKAIRKLYHEKDHPLGIGMALQRSATEYCPEKVTHLWKLTDEAEPKIRQYFEQWSESYLGNENAMYKEEKISQLDRIISKWPKVERRTSPHQIIFSVCSTNFCWLHPRSGMIQLRPSLGPRCVTRRLEHVENETEVIHQQSGRIDAVYHDPRRILIVRWSYPGFMCSSVTLEDAINLVMQAYETAKRRS